jgi:hypothetical protein
MRLHVRGPWIAHLPGDKSMTTIFETPRFRIHIAGKSAWLENREPGGWVLRAQLAIPVSAHSLTAADQTSPLRAAVLDFENARLGDTSLRAALTGTRESRTRSVAPVARAQTAPARIVSKPQLPKPTNGQHGWRQPVRPPLKPVARYVMQDDPKLPPPDPDPERDPPLNPLPLPDPDSPGPDVIDPGMPEPLQI